jgi:hypothetical protein
MSRVPASVPLVRHDYQDLFSKNNMLYELTPPDGFFLEALQLCIAPGQPLTSTQASSLPVHRACDDL